MEAPEKVITALNQADVSEQEKNEAKTLLRKLLGSKAAFSVLGPGAQFLAAKHFTEYSRQRAPKIRWLPSQAGIRKTRNGESFGKNAQTVLADEVNYRVLRTRQNRKITSWEN